MEKEERVDERAREKQEKRERETRKRNCERKNEGKKSSKKQHENFFRATGGGRSNIFYPLSLSFFLPSTSFGHGIW